MPHGSTLTADRWCRRGRNNAAPGIAEPTLGVNGTLTVLAATFSGNVADQGGGVYNLGDSGTANATIDGTILANSSSANDIKGSTRAGGSQTANGSNDLIESQSGFTGSITSTADPQLGPAP